VSPGESAGSGSRSWLPGFLDDPHRRRIAGFPADRWLPYGSPADGDGHDHAAGTSPGEILLTEFLEPLGVSQDQLAKAVDVPARRINEIVHGQRRISADTALRLSRYFGTSERFWLNLQARYDLEIERTAWARRST